MNAPLLDRDGETFADRRRRDHVRQPRRGDILDEGRWGRVEVESVHERGRVLRVVTKQGHVERVERAEAGCWLRIARAERGR